MLLVAALVLVLGLVLVLVLVLVLTLSRWRYQEEACQLCLPPHVPLRVSGPQEVQVLLACSKESHVTLPYSHVLVKGVFFLPDGQQELILLLRTHLCYC